MHCNKQANLMKMATRAHCISVLFSPVLVSSLSLTRKESRSGPTWSGRTRARPPAPRPPPPCARPPPPPARCPPPGRTCVRAAVRRFWTDTCWRWEAQPATFSLERRERFSHWKHLVYSVGYALFTRLVVAQVGKKKTAANESEGWHVVPGLVSVCSVSRKNLKATTELWVHIWYKEEKTTKIQQHNLKGQYKYLQPLAVW